MASNDSFILDITWHEDVKLPSLVGPFLTREEADQWATLNIPNGSFEIAPLAYPYLSGRVGR